MTGKLIYTISNVIINSTDAKGLPSTTRMPLVECFPTGFFSSPRFILLSIVLMTLNISVLFGNILVIIGVKTSAKFRSAVTQVFIINLALADLGVGGFVLPFSMAQELLDKRWPFGPILCSIWLAVDVWLCTASILSLLVIAMDRFLVICRALKYPTLVTAFRARLLVAAVWLIAFIICIPTACQIFWFNDIFLITENKSQNLNSSVSQMILNDSITDSKLANLKFDKKLLAVEHVLVDKNISLDLFTIETHQSIPRCPEWIEQKYSCIVNTPNIAIKLYSALGSFFLPSMFLIYFYFRIFLKVYANAKGLREGVINVTPYKSSKRHHTCSSLVSGKCCYTACSCLFSTSSSHWISKTVNTSNCDLKENEAITEAYNRAKRQSHGLRVHMGGNSTLKYASVRKSGYKPPSDICSSKTTFLTGFCGKPASTDQDMFRSCEKRNHYDIPSAEHIAILDEIAPECCLSERCKFMYEKNIPGTNLNISAKRSPDLNELCTLDKQHCTCDGFKSGRQISLPNIANELTCPECLFDKENFRRVNSLMGIYVKSPEEEIINDQDLSNKHKSCMLRNRNLVVYTPFESFNSSCCPVNGKYFSEHSQKLVNLTTSSGAHVNTFNEINTAFSSSVPDSVLTGSGRFPCTLCQHAKVSNESSQNASFKPALMNNSESLTIKQNLKDATRKINDDINCTSKTTNEIVTKGEKLDRTSDNIVQFNVCSNASYSKNANLAEYFNTVTNSKRFDRNLSNSLMDLPVKLVFPIKSKLCHSSSLECNATSNKSNETILSKRKAKSSSNSVFSNDTRKKEFALDRDEYLRGNSRNTSRCINPDELRSTSAKGKRKELSNIKFYRQPSPHPVRPYRLKLVKNNNVVNKIISSPAHSKNRPITKFDYARNEEAPVSELSSMNSYNKNRTNNECKGNLRNVTNRNYAYRNDQSSIEFTIRKNEELDRNLFLFSDPAIRSEHATQDLDNPLISTTADKNYFNKSQIHCSTKTKTLTKPANILFKSKIRSRFNKVHELSSSIKNRLVSADVHDYDDNKNNNDCSKACEQKTANLRAEDLCYDECDGAQWHRNDLTDMRQEERQKTKTGVNLASDNLRERHSSTRCKRKVFSFLFRNLPASNETHLPVAQQTTNNAPIVQNLSKPSKEKQVYQINSKNRPRAWTHTSMLSKKTSLARQKMFRSAWFWRTPYSHVAGNTLTYMSTPSGSACQGHSPSYTLKNLNSSHSSASTSKTNRETKAVRLLGIVCGTFIICWLPFFTVYLVGAFVPPNAIAEVVFDVCFWLGYYNSALNPLIYALVSRELRFAFKRILCCGRMTTQKKKVVEMEARRLRMMSTKCLHDSQQQ